MKSAQSDTFLSESHPFTWRMEAYRKFFKVLKICLGRLLVGASRWSETEIGLQKLTSLSGRDKGREVLWFHAASVGELESLWPLVELSAMDGNLEIILTVFSGSAWNHLHRMARHLPGRSPLYVGYSPLEGDWTEAIRASGISIFVTAKYEAWPEMWNALGDARVPLVIVGAKARSSLLWAKRILTLLGGKIPSILFFSFDLDNSGGLAAAFPDSEIQVESDPRWDRVYQRSLNPQPRVAELVRSYADLPKPWGVIGSAWSSDLVQLPTNAAESIRGTLWVVPHKVDPKSLSEIEILLRERGFTPTRTSDENIIKPAGNIAVLVDEMGFLAELYSVMDWCFVGGGFGSSIHSTIEPSLYGLPLLGGPHGREKFDEILMLEKQGQLAILPSKDERLSRSNIFHLIDSFSRVGIEQRKQWAALNLRHRGASVRIWRVILNRLKNER
ncbi:MAG: hypothetical protein H7301_14075 [Cryobacterium sp.]|nr:hypothetical protein [Oligoflexia bacterium]